MSRVSRLDRIHGKCTNGIDAELVDSCCFYLGTHKCTPYQICQYFATELSSPVSLSSVVFGLRFSLLCCHVRPPRYVSAENAVLRRDGFSPGQLALPAMREGAVLNRLTAGQRVG